TSSPRRAAPGRSRAAPRSCRAAPARRRTRPPSPAPPPRPRRLRRPPAGGAASTPRGDGSRGSAGEPRGGQREDAGDRVRRLVAVGGELLGALVGVEGPAARPAD